MDAIKPLLIFHQYILRRIQQAGVILERLNLRISCDAGPKFRLNQNIIVRIQRDINLVHVDCLLAAPLS